MLVGFPKYIRSSWNFVHGDHALHTRTVKLDRMGDVDNWDFKKQTVFFLHDFCLPSKFSIVNTWCTHL